MDNNEMKLYLKWGGNKFPSPFEKETLYSNILFSKYSIQSKAATNRISYSAVNFILTKYLEDEKMQRNIAIGTTLHETIVEQTSLENYSIAIYNRSDGQIIAFVVNKDTNAIELYPDDGSYDGLLLLMALWEVLYSDEEFFTQYSSFKENMKSHDYEEAWENVTILSDNIYRRLKNDSFPLKKLNDKVSVNSIKDGLVKEIFVPTNNISNNQFQFLKTVEDVVTKTIPLEDFIGKYQLNPNREYTAEENILMAENKIEDYYIVGSDDIEICNDILHTSDSPKPFRTFTLVGPPGTGKSKKVKAIANAIVLPNTIFTCNPSTEIFDLIGQVMPPDMDEMEKESWDLAARLEELGGINFKNICKVYSLPTVTDILACPDEVYMDITGSKLTDSGRIPTVNDAVKAWTLYMSEQFNQVLRKMKVSMKTGTGFKFTETDFIKSVEKGWVCEIQEPNVILNEGVLVGLNSILNEGIITLQNGRTITRHPDSVIFFTTNHNLNGLRNMNQSFLDRSDEIFYVEKPDIAVMADRVMAISGNNNRKMIVEMCKLSNDIADAMEKEGIDDGICGMRSIIAWAIKASYTNPYDAAIKTLINKASLDSENRVKLKTKLDESYFYQYKGK